MDVHWIILGCQGKALPSLFQVLPDWAGPHLTPSDPSLSPLNHLYFYLPATSGTLKWCLS